VVGAWALLRMTPVSNWVLHELQSDIPWGARTHLVYAHWDIEIVPAALSWSTCILRINLDSPRSFISYCSLSSAHACSAPTIDDEMPVMLSVYVLIMVFSPSHRQYPGI
jgi:hypothetical protein